jgi:hypothetical protein
MLLNIDKKLEIKMKTNSRLAQFLKVLLDILYGGLVIAGILLFLWIFLSPFLIRVGVPGTSSVSVAIGSGTESRFDVSFDNEPGDEIQHAFVEATNGILRLETTSWTMILISNSAKLITAIGLAYFFYLLRKVLITIIEEKPFGPENGTRIRRIGYLILVLGFVIPTADYIAANEILNRLPSTYPELGLPSPFKAEIILASLLVLLLAQVWSYGMELERDQSLTI